MALGAINRVLRILRPLGDEYGFGRNSALVTALGIVSFLMGCAIPLTSLWLVPGHSTNRYSQSDIAMITGMWIILAILIILCKGLIGFLEPSLANSGWLIVGLINLLAGLSLMISHVDLDFRVHTPSQPVIVQRLVIRR